MDTPYWNCVLCEKRFLERNKQFRTRRSLQATVDNVVISVKTVVENILNEVIDLNPATHFVCSDCFHLSKSFYRKQKKELSNGKNLFAEMLKEENLMVNKPCFEVDAVLAAKKSATANPRVPVRAKSTRVRKKRTEEDYEFDMKKVEPGLNGGKQKKRRVSPPASPPLPPPPPPPPPPRKTRTRKTEVETDSDWQLSDRERTNAEKRVFTSGTTRDTTLDATSRDAESRDAGSITVAVQNNIIVCGRCSSWFVSEAQYESHACATTLTSSSAVRDPSASTSSMMSDPDQVDTSEVKDLGQVDTSEVKDEKPDLDLCFRCNDMFTSAYELAAHYSRDESARNDDDIGVKYEQELPCEQEVRCEQEIATTEHSGVSAAAPEAMEVSDHTYAVTIGNRDDGERNKYTCTLCGDSFGYQVPYKKHFAKHYEQTPAAATAPATADVRVFRNIFNAVSDNGATSSCHVVSDRVRSSDGSTTTLKSRTQNSERKEFQSSTEETIASVAAGAGVIRQPMTVDARRQRHTCTQCSKTFKTRVILARHTCRDADYKPYRCSVCACAFKSVKAHRNHFHTHTYRPRPYDCRFCEKSCLTRKQLDRHLRYSHPDVRMYTCGDCHQTFQTSDNLSAHRARHHAGEFLCQVCAKVFKSENTYSLHMNLHDPNNPLKCTICDRSCINKGDYDRHRLVHSNERPHACPHCDWRFAKAGDLQRHLKRHVGDRRYVCDVCGKRYIWKSDLAAHMDSHRTDPFQCDACAKYFRSRAYLHEHRNQMHLDLMTSTAKCNKCQRHFSSVRACLIHEKLAHRSFRKTLNARESTASVTQDGSHPVDGAVETGETTAVGTTATSTAAATVSTAKPRNRASCRACVDGFATTNELSDHVNAKHNVSKRTRHTAAARRATPALKVPRDRTNLHTPSAVKKQRGKLKDLNNSFKCTICDRLFTDKTCYMRHQLVHSNERPHACPHCDRRFALPNALRRHVQRHVGDKQHVCDVCGKRFVTKQNLIKHMDSHRTEPFQCDVCAKYVRTRSDFYAHRNHVHPDTTTSAAKCTHCQRRFSSARACLIHEKMSHRSFSETLKPRQSTSTSQDGVSGVDGAVETAAATTVETTASVSMPKKPWWIRSRCVMCVEGFTTTDELFNHVSAEHKHHIRKRARATATAARVTPVHEIYSYRS